MHNLNFIGAPESERTGFVLVRISFLAVFPPVFLMPASSQCMDKPENSESKKDNLFNCVPNISFWFYFQFLS